MKGSGLTQSSIETCVRDLIMKAAMELPPDVITALEDARKKEQKDSAKRVLGIILENSRLARAKRLPICQDTGIDCVFVRLGTEICPAFDLTCAINNGIRCGTRDGFLRASVADPITRANTNDNTPGVIHLELVPGKELEITVLPKGCGSENMSAVYMLPPSHGEKGIEDRVMARVKAAGANPCPPGIIGIGIGGTMEKAALLAKKALLRPIGTHSDRADVRAMEQRLLKRINALGIGPLGLGGDTTALWVAIETYPCHIASLPVAINYQCHAARRAKATFTAGRWEMEP